MTSRKEEAFALAEKLLSLGIDVVGAAEVTLDEQWARNPKIVGLGLCCRSLTNFRGALILLNDRHPHVLEARVLARCLYENLLWIASVRQRGAEFVNQMLVDDAANRTALGELALKLSRKHGGDPNDEKGLLLRRLIDQTKERFAERQKLHANKVAEQTVIELAYSEYARLSLEAVHSSVTALGRHVEREHVEGGHVLTVVVAPEESDMRVVDTIVVLCKAMVGIVITANEIVGFTRESERVKQLHDEFEKFQAN